MKSKCTVALLFLTAVFSGLSTGCKKKVVVAPPPPPPVQEVPPLAPPAPTAVLTAEPATVERGQAVTLKWSSTDATEVAISALGAVASEGKQELRPAESITYELVAKGPGGSTRASAIVSVIAPPPPPAAPPRVQTKSFRDRVESELSDIHFDYDRSDIREDARATLVNDIDAIRSILSDFPNATLVLEGHCDERGSAEYNLGLGDRRAEAVRASNEALGVKPTALEVVSYGKESPQCTESTDECLQKNRRVHFAPGEIRVETH
ncbi:MAG: OmpA family protein [Candidatus Solibacter sp.]